MDPVYAQTANSHGENDYGDTYVEINLTAQHLYFYKNGNLVVDSDFVSGNISKETVLRLELIRLPIQSVMQP